MTLAIASCSSQLGESSTQISLIAEKNLSQCRPLGVVSATADLTRYDSDDDKVLATDPIIQAELLASARQQGQQLGGDAVQEEGALINGTQHYRVYDCRLVKSRTDEPIIGFEIETPLQFSGSAN
jgi:hypothetical protein